jgi:hypothetical protein
MLGVLDHFWSLIVPRYALRTPFRSVIGFITISTTCNYNHLLHSYTFTLADFSAINYCLKLSHTLHLHTSHVCLLCETSLVEQLLNNWLLRHSSSSYITLNCTSVTVACCLIHIAATSQVRAVLRHSQKREGHMILPYSCCRVTSPRHVA